MKYFTIYEQIMQSELKTAEYESYKNNAVGRINDEWLAILVALRYPKSHPREMMERIEEKKEFQISYEMLIRCLRSVNLDDPGKRCYILPQIEEAAENLKKALNGDKETAQEFAEFASNMTERDNARGKMYFKAKYLLVYLIWMDEEMKNMQYAQIARCYGERYCERVIRQLKKEINRQLGIKEEKKTAKDVLQKTEAVLASTERDYDMTGSDELARLRFLNENYRNSLEMVQSMFDELKESVEESAEEAKKVAISDFFGKLNSPAYGNLLDNLLVVEKNLANARKEGIKLPPQLMSLGIIFKQLIRFVKDSGIEPIETVGREFHAAYEDISLLNYVGEPYEKDGEIKKLKVSTPGWRYGDVIISTPTVQEILEE